MGWYPMGRPSEVFKGNEFVFFQVLEECPKAFIQRFYPFSEFFFESPADFFNRSLAVTQLPYEGTDIVKVDLEMRVFQSREDVFNHPGVAVFRFKKNV